MKDYDWIIFVHLNPIPRHITEDFASAYSVVRWELHETMKQHRTLFAQMCSVISFRTQMKHEEINQHQPRQALIYIYVDRIDCSTIISFTSNVMRIKRNLLTIMMRWSNNTPTAFIVMNIQLSIYAMEIWLVGYILLIKCYFCSCFAPHMNFNWCRWLPSHHLFVFLFL